MGTMRSKAGVLAVASAVVLAGCGWMPDEVARPAPASIGPIDYDTTLDLGVPGEPVSVTMGVEYYPGCGTEVLEFEDTAYFPYEPADVTGFPSPVGTEASAASRPTLEGGQLGFARASAPMPSIVPPGPGDDTGTLTVYEGGFAYWVSDSGDLATWLATTRIEYLWIC